MRTVCTVQVNANVFHMSLTGPNYLVPNGYTCDVIPFLKTHNSDIFHLPCVIIHLLVFTIKQLAMP